VNRRPPSTSALLRRRVCFRAEGYRTVERRMCVCSCLKANPVLPFQTEIFQTKTFGFAQGLWAVCAADRALFT
jgi:hypothetical protein